MTFVLNIQVLPNMKVQSFTVSLDLTGPATLQIKPGEFGQGNRISIIDAQGERREWFATQLHGLYFEGP